MDVRVRDLRYLIAVADQASFSRAAERLYLSQPALSKQIRVLEAELGVTLLERTPGGVTPTAAGTVLLERARQIVEIWNEAQAATRSAARTQAQVLRVGTLTAIGRSLYPSVVDDFTEAMPGWRIDLRAISWSDPTAGLADATTDAAFVWLPLPGSAGLELSHHVLASERRFLAVSSHHQLAHRSALTLADIEAEPLVALPASAGSTREFWLADDVRTAGPARIAAEANSPDEKFEMVATGTASVLLAEGNVALYSRPGIVCIPVTDLPPARLAVAWRAGDRRAAVHEFVRACRDAASVGRLQGKAGS